jgi:hypothetical protein
MMPTEGSQNPIEHPNAKEPPTPTTVILARLPLTSFSIRSFPVTPIAMPIIVPHAKLNTANYRFGLCEGYFLRLFTLAAVVAYGYCYLYQDLGIGQHLLRAFGDCAIT